MLSKSLKNKKANNEAVNKTNKAKENKIMKNTKKNTNKANEFEMIMNAINELTTEIADIKADVNELKSKGTTNKRNAKTTATKGKSTKKSAPTEKKAKANNGKKSTKKNAPTTKSEAIEQWKSSKYSDEEREEYGIAAREVREEMMAENKKMVKTVKGNKVYDDNYYVGAKWKKEFKARMKERGFSVK